jgi:hypothetical protein
MLEIIALVCTVANPFKCDDIRLPSRVTDSLQTCTDLAPADLAKWLGENRAWIVRDYRCARVNIASK